MDPLLPVHQRVRSLHGLMPGREGPLAWAHTQDAAIEYAENNLFVYYVRLNGLMSLLVVARTADGHKFLKARCDAEQPDTLLALPWFNSVNPSPGTVSKVSPASPSQAG
ncbi:MAG TPA: DUF3892 domain-containing protein [Candidatus Sulfotelmatobacter sp.]|nr:DUF3892 domain-containing protein [Candidatus Sulfotelmatobacter sp.]